jgi:arsenate reductase
MTNVLFVCVQNAGRSQMAQAFYEQRGGSARSAGSAPAD